MSVIRCALLISIHRAFHGSLSLSQHLTVIHIQVNLFFSSKQLQFLRVSYFFVSSVKRNGVLSYCCVSYGFRTNNWALIRVIELVYSSSFRKEEPLTLALPKRRSSKKIFPPSAWNDPHDGTITVSCLPVYVQGSCKMNFYVCVHTHIVVATTEFFKYFPCTHFSSSFKVKIFYFCWRFDHENFSVSRERLAL